MTDTATRHNFASMANDIRWLVVQQLLSWLLSVLPNDQEGNELLIAISEWVDGPGMRRARRQMEKLV